MSNDRINQLSQKAKRCANWISLLSRRGDTTESGTKLHAAACEHHAAIDALVAIALAASQPQAAPADTEAP